MDPNKAHTVVCEVLHHIQSTLAGECPPLNPSTVPLKALSEMDSPISLGATGMIGRRLGIEIPPELNLFGDNTGKFSIAKTVGIICKLSSESNEDKKKAAGA